MGEYQKNASIFRADTFAKGIYALGVEVGDNSGYLLHMLEKGIIFNAGFIIIIFNTLRTELLNCLNARSRGLTFRHRASSI